MRYELSVLHVHHFTCNLGKISVHRGINRRASKSLRSESKNAKAEEGQAARWHSNFLNFRFVPL